MIEEIKIDGDNLKFLNDLQVVEIEKINQLIRQNKRIMNWIKKHYKGEDVKENLPCNISSFSDLPGKHDEQKEYINIDDIAIVEVKSLQINFYEQLKHDYKELIKNYKGVRRTEQNKELFYKAIENFFIINKINDIQFKIIENEGLSNCFIIQPLRNIDKIIFYFLES